ncbi:hypothetical protein UAM5_00010 [Ralstonia phage UAM5]|nr:hypothetical protein UAM5_00010 [Ralstonia phage UAM5]
MLKQILEQYRAGERGLPTYDELAAIVGADHDGHAQINETAVRQTSLNDELSDEQIIDIYDRHYTHEDDRGSDHILSFARDLLATAPCATQRVEHPTYGMDEQSAFEDWFERTAPSGDVEQVQCQWEEYRQKHLWPSISSSDPEGHRQAIADHEADQQAEPAGDARDAARYRRVRDLWFEWGMHNINTPLGAALNALATVGDRESLDVVLDSINAAAPTQQQGRNPQPGELWTVRCLSESEVFTATVVEMFTEEVAPGPAEPRNTYPKDDIEFIDRLKAAGD